MSAPLQLVVSELPDILIDETQIRPLIPSRIYRVAYVEHETKFYFNSPKVVFRFRILDLGSEFGTILERYYNVAKFVGKPGRGGKFEPSAGGDFVIEFLRCFDHLVKRIDRLPLSLFQTSILKVRVDTITKNSIQRKLPEKLQYSKIAEILGVDRDFTG